VVYIGRLYEDRQFIIVPGEVNISTSAMVDNNWFEKCNVYADIASMSKAGKTSDIQNPNASLRRERQGKRSKR